jgi:hypothetical protein
MDEKNKPPESQIDRRPIDRRTIFLVIATFVLSFIGFFLIDNKDIILASQVPQEQWDRIDTRVVESNCLEQAKKVAISEGYSDVFVISCTCINVQSEILKTFDCNVNTADIINPARKVLVHCYRTSSDCTIASDRGLETHSFLELEEVILK